ncbi:MAG: phage transcriptional regulator, AlpA, partial [Rhodoferax sp.]|nr:phage transcriptional regulator, AlpA [Rhodoferax sp.]
SALLRKPAVLSLTGMGATTLYDRIKKGLFTSPIKIGVRLSGWLAREVAELNRALAAGKTEDEIRAIVKDLEAARKAVSQH